MKKKLLKGVLVLSLAGALAFSGVGVGTGGTLDAYAAKIVAKADLSPVTGIAYNATTGRVSWNKVSGATRYDVEIKNAAGTKVWSTTWNYNLYVTPSLSSGSYTVTVKAINRNEAYVVASNLTSTAGYTYGTDYNYSEWDSDGTKVTLYKYPSSTGTAAITVTDTKSSSTTTITALPCIKLKEKGDTSATFTTSAALTLREDEQLRWEYSNNAKFESNSAKDLFKYTSTKYDGQTDLDLSVSYSYFNPGDTIYVRARIYNSAYNYKTSSDEKYTAYSAVVTLTTPKAKMSGIGVVSTASSIQLTANTTRGVVTGYQFAKKVGSKWVTLGTSTDNTFVDNTVLKETTYSYRARAYTYNETTKKTIWTDWLETKAMTWGSNLALKADAASASSVKLTWKKIAGAQGYEVYRYETGSNTLNYDKGVSVESHSAEFLVKTLGKSKKSYTDKKLTKGRSYTYVVRAYKTIGKQKVYIVDSASISLKAGSISGADDYVTAAGKYVATWSKATGLKGYYVERQDPLTSQWTTIKTLKGTATSYTFDKVNPGSDTVTYRIRPFDGDAVYSGYTVRVYPTIAAPTKVKAVKTANGVQVSWSAVAGADYYEVYRTTSSRYTYNKTTKAYSYTGGESVYEGAVNTTGCQPEKNAWDTYNSMGTYATTSIRTTSVEDKALTYRQTARDDNGDPIVASTLPDGTKIYQTEETFYDNVQGPEAGKTYYYYVVACVDDANGAVSSGTMTSACTKAAEVTYTNKAATKVSKITAAKSKKKGQVTVSYKKVKGVSGYAIYRSTKKNGTYTLVGTTTKTSFTDASAPSKKTVYYKVASYVTGEVKANIYSAKTAAKSVKVK